MIIAVSGLHIEDHQAGQFFDFLFVFCQYQRQLQQVFVIQATVPMRSMKQAAGGMHVNLFHADPVEALNPEVTGPPG